MSPHPRPWVGVAVMLLSAIVSACSTQARWVNCEGRLEPINRPAPKAKAVPEPELSSRAKKEQGAR
jgi:hypothetical protein